MVLRPPARPTPLAEGLVVAAALAAVLAGGCIEFVGADDPLGQPQDGGRPVQASVAVDSPGTNTIAITLVRADRARGYDLADANRTFVEVDGLACRALRAGEDTWWEVGEDVVLTVQTSPCGLAIETGRRVQVRVVLLGTLVHEGVVVVR